MAACIRVGIGLRTVSAFVCNLFRNGCGIAADNLLLINNSSLQHKCHGMYFDGILCIMCTNNLHRNFFEIRASDCVFVLVLFSRVARLCNSAKTRSGALMLPLFGGECLCNTNRNFNSINSKEVVKRHSLILRIKSNTIDASGS